MNDCVREQIKRAECAICGLEKGLSDMSETAKKTTEALKQLAIEAQSAVEKSTLERMKWHG